MNDNLEPMNFRNFITQILKEEMLHLLGTYGKV